MMENHVSMGQHECPACGKMFDSGEVLLATQYYRGANGELRPRRPMERRTVTGLSPCADCRKEGYVMLVAARKEGGSMYRTGDVVHLKAEAWERVFMGTAMPKDGWSFCDPQVVVMLRSMMEPNGEGGSPR